MTAWVRTAEELSRLADALRQLPAIGLDTESDSLYHYFEKVCLLQLAGASGEAWLVDTLVLRDLSPLQPILADPRIVKVLHGADYDVTTLKRDFGFELRGLFDTMIAARFLGMPEIGLQAVARDVLGIAISKDSQRDDWSRRPLTSRQETYALEDVRHLVALRDHLAARLGSAGRLEWVEEECQAVAALGAARKAVDPEAYLRVKGAARLTRRSLAVLRELHAWRERRAAELDRPAFKVLSGDALLALAERAPRSATEIGSVRGVPPRFASRAREILDAVERAMAVPEADLPAIRRVARPIVPDTIRRRVASLKAWRAREAGRTGLDVSVLLPQRLLERVAETPPHAVDDLLAIEGFRRWRASAFGRTLVEVSRAS
jgi:ribonuclease D